MLFQLRAMVPANMRTLTFIAKLLLALFSLESLRIISATSFQSQLLMALKRSGTACWADLTYTVWSSKYPASDRDRVPK